MKSVLLKDPLLHFGLLGLVLFAFFFGLRDSRQPASEEITVSSAQQEQLARAFERVWRRSPSEAEYKGLIDDWVREEIANREALAMGLGEDDLIIRRRLRQKYEALMEQIAASVEPDADELMTWYADHADAYLRDPRYSLHQRFFSSDRRRDAEADASEALHSLGDKVSDTAGAAIGDSLPIPEVFTDTSATEFRDHLGREFSAALAALPTGRWSGPIASAYGYHLVYLESKIPAQQPALDEIRDAVLRDWRDVQLREAQNTLYTALLQRYTVQLEP